MFDELFKLFGIIKVDNSEANQNIEETTNKAKESGNHLKDLSDKFTKIGDGFTKVGEKLMPISVGLAGVGTMAINTASTFEDGMLKVRSLTGATQEEFDALTETAKRYGATTAWTARDVADAMGYMGLAGFDVGQIMESTAGMLNLASASGEDLATVTDILTDSMTAFGDGADQASRYADVLATTQAKSNTTVGLLGEAFKYVAPVAGSYGYALEDVATSLGVMANAGIKGSIAGNSLSTIMTRLATNAGATSKSMGALEVLTEKLHVEFYNADGTTRNLSEVMKDMITATQDLSVEEKAEIAKKIAGQEAMKGLLAILNQGTDAYQDLEDVIKSSGGSAEDMAKMMESGTGGSIRAMKSALEGLSITIGEQLAPTVIQITDKISELALQFQELTPEEKEQIVQIGVIAAAIPPLLVGIGKVTSGIGSMIDFFSKLVPATEAAGGAVQGAGAVIGGLSATTLGVVAVIAVLIAAFVDLWKNNEEFRNRITTTWNQVKNTFDNFVNGIKTELEALGIDFSEFGIYAEAAWKTLCDFLGAVFTVTWNQISNIFKFVTDYILNYLRIFVGIFTGDWKKVLDAVSNIISSGLEFIMNMFVNLMNGANQVTGGKLGEMLNSWRDKIEGIKGIVKSGLDAINGFFNGLQLKFPDIKVPHFSIEGEFSLDPPSVPSFGIEWYAKAMKEPFMFTSPTVMGMKGFGDAGDEIVYGRENLMNDIRQAQDSPIIQEKMNRMIELLEQFLNLGIRLDSGVLVGQIAPQMDEALGDIYDGKGRGGRIAW